MSQLYWISFLVKEDKIRNNMVFLGYNEFLGYLGTILVDDPIRGPFAVFPNYKENCEPYVRGSYNDVRSWFKRIGIEIPKTPLGLYWRLNNFGDYSTPVVYY